MGDAETDEEATAVQGLCSRSCCKWDLELPKSIDEQIDRRFDGVVQAVEREHEQDDTGQEVLGAVGELLMDSMCWGRPPRFLAGLFTSRDLVLPVSRPRATCRCLVTGTNL